MSKSTGPGRPRGQRMYDFNSEVALMTRLRRGWTQRDVSDRCEQFGSGRVDDSNIAKYERGDLCPSPQSLASLAAALELQVDDLIILRKAVA